VKRKGGPKANPEPGSQQNGAKTKIPICKGKEREVGWVGN